MSKLSAVFDFLLDGLTRIWRTWCFIFYFSDWEWLGNRISSSQQSAKHKHHPLLSRFGPCTHTPPLVPCTTLGPWAAATLLTLLTTGRHGLLPHCPYQFQLQKGQNSAGLANFLFMGWLGFVEPGAGFFCSDSVFWLGMVWVQISIFFTLIKT